MDNTHLFNKHANNQEIKAANKKLSGDDFIRNPKFKGYYNEKGFAVDIKYEVEINFRHMNRRDIVKFTERGLSELEIVEIKDNYVKLLWPIESYGEPEEIDVEMYYLLENGEMGNYTYYRIN